MMRLPKLPSLNALMPISIDERRRASAAYEQANPGYDASVFARLQPKQPDMNGVVFQGGQSNAGTGYVAPQTIPGTVVNNTGRTIDGGEIIRDTPSVQAQVPWFSAPWGNAAQSQDLPWWQRGLRK